ncbi:MAG: cupin domain-containing protein [Clostridiales bacterium]|jgi:quercetin dioxygenase-like cupin family protein|nr:cupin domain-containing protein [Clostridiales bacterium]
MQVIKKSNVPVRDFGEGLKLQILLDKQNNAKNLDMGTVEIAPNSKTGMHSRSFEEVIYMLKGEGQVVLENGEVYTLQTGDSILIPPGITHCHANATNEPLEQLYIFAPQAGDKIQTQLRELRIIKG